MDKNTIDKKTRVIELLNTYKNEVQQDNLTNSQLDYLLDMLDYTQPFSMNKDIVSSIYIGEIIKKYYTKNKNM